MLDWRRRLYAFLLRRVLGPFLDDRATSKLHASIEFSLDDGIFVLKDVALDAEKLSDLSSSAGLSITKATVERLEIKLALRDNANTESQPSLAWRAMKLGGSTTEKESSLPSVSLLAEVHVQGLNLEVQPCSCATRKESGVVPVVEDGDESAGDTKSRIRSYIDAALSSLQLTLKLSNLNIKLIKDNTWVSLRVALLNLKDVYGNPITDDKLKVVINKTVEISDISASVGDDEKETETAVMLAKGNGKIFLRIQQDRSCPEKQHHSIEAKLGHRLSISLDVASIRCLVALVAALDQAQRHAVESSEFDLNLNQQVSSKATISRPMDDEEDLKAITGIMKQYREEHHLAETDHLRGGVLIPSHAYEDDIDRFDEDDTMTFDLFWDAEEHNSYDVASKLRDSMILTGSSSEGRGNSPNAEMMFNLLSVSLKINFRGLRSEEGPQEYILVTLDDLFVSSSTHDSRSELEFTVDNFAIEDAYRVQHGRNIKTSRVEIGSMFNFERSFMSHNVEENSGEEILSQSPSFKMNACRADDGTETFDCVFSPLEMNARQRSLSSLLLLGRRLGSENDAAHTRSTGQEKESSRQTRQLTFKSICPSITIYVPLLGRMETSRVFNRCGETIRGAQPDEACLGLAIHDIALMYDTKHPEQNDGVSSVAAVQICRIFAFAWAPKDKKSIAGSTVNRTDLFLLDSRTEVQPYIPLSFEYKTVTPPSKEGRTSFPIVPPISSFKNRQEDDDDKVIQLIDSKRYIEQQSLEGARNISDPQVRMVTATETCCAIVSLRIPEIICDLTKGELSEVTEMLGLVKFQDSDIDTVPTKKLSDSKTSVALRVDQISLSLKQDFCVQDIYGDASNNDRYSCLFAADTFRIHLLFCGSSMMHSRVLVHDFTIYAAYHPRIDAEVSRVERSFEARAKAMKQRIAVYNEARLSPIIFRTKLWTSICAEAPSILLDVLDVNQEETDQGSGFSQKQINLTFYHITFRYDPDSDWIDRLRDLLPSQPEVSSTQTVPSEKAVQAIQSPSMTRFFLSVADCNIDYVSPKYFSTASRNIIRLGDLQCSSNLMVPKPPKQAFSLTVGDLSFFLHNKRISQLSEDVKLCRASRVLGRLDTKLKLTSRLGSIAAEALLREEGFVEVLTLTSADLVVVVVNGERNCSTSDPAIAIDASFGKLSLSACKDSFQCFVATVGEVQAKLTAMSEETISKLKNTEKVHSVSSRKPSMSAQSNPVLEKRNSESGWQEKRPISNHHKDFLLDGYEWTEVDHDPLPEISIPDGDEQAAGWYTQLNDNGSRKESAHSPTSPSNQSHGFPTRVIHHHFPFHSLSSPLASGSMGAEKYAGEHADLNLKVRLVLHKLAIKLRFHDGYDWPNGLSERERELQKDGDFIIAPPRRDDPKASLEDIASVDDLNVDRDPDRVKDLLSELLSEQEIRSGGFSPFEDSPLPEERARTLLDKAEFQRLSRKSKTYLQVSMSGITSKVDSYARSQSHRLASAVGVSIGDMFIAETASTSVPVKMLGEWANEKEHPRDTRYGILMLKMITWNPVRPLTKDNEIENDECEMTLQLLPMRAIIDQRAIKFIQSYFHSDTVEDPKDWKIGLHLAPPPRFRAFRVKKWKLKVDYNPQKLDIHAIRDGSIVELLNFSPIDGMVITLSQVSVENVVGFGDVMSALTGSWLDEVVSTQLHKFLANARPFEPVSDIGQGLSDLVVLPYEAFMHGDNVSRAVASGVTSLAGTMTFQALTTTSRLTEYAASKMAALIGGRLQELGPLPMRPTVAPKLGEVTGHAMESLARGLQAANYKIVIVPYREYNRNGAIGAAGSVLRGIPVLLFAPTSGAVEAMSYTLLGARNALRPDIQREEEASRTGFTHHET